MWQITEHVKQNGVGRRHAQQVTLFGVCLVSKPGQDKYELCSDSFLCFPQILRTLRACHNLAVTQPRILRCTVTNGNGRIALGIKHHWVINCKQDGGSASLTLSLPQLTKNYAVRNGS
jgi:hypothetical protein